MGARRLSYAACGIVVLGMTFIGAATAEPLSSHPDARRSDEMASPPPERQSEGVSESARREAALRATLGFRSDPTYVQQLIHDPERFDAMADEESFGYHFTPDERQEFLDRMALQRSGIDIATWALKHATHDYAGSRLDHAAGGVLVVGFRSEPGGRRAAVMERVSDSGRGPDPPGAVLA